jgi:hypothetical protein
MAAKRQIGRPFKKKVPAPTKIIAPAPAPVVRAPAPPVPTPQPEPRLFDPMTEEKWRGNLDMVMWWRAVLGQPHGRALVELIRARVPTALSGLQITTDVGNAVKLAQLHRESEGSMLGMIAGYELLKDILLNRLTSHIAQPVRMRSPGQDIEPHHVSPPS